MPPLFLACMDRWHCYMVKCADGTYYVGITTDLKRRLHEHNSSKNGAKYTRGRRPVRLAYWIICQSRSDAARREARLKKLTHAEKQKWDNSGS